MKAKVSLEVGKGYLFRTVTMIYTGELVEEQVDRFVVKKAAWIAETESWTKAVADSAFKEVEIYPSNKFVMLFKSGMLDIVEIDELPLEQKP